jgi:hypothetical protein
MVDVSRDKGRKGEVWGPCACPRSGGEVESPSGQAQGPRILVPASPCPYTIPSLQKMNRTFLPAFLYRWGRYAAIGLYQHRVVAYQCEADVFTSLRCNT